MSSKKQNTRNRILETAWHLLEEEPGKELGMGAIAKAAGISRQALYLHFASRTELLIAVVQYVDEVKGLQERLKPFEQASSGTEMLESCAEVWCNYIPEIYGIAKALLRTKDQDEAAAAAWTGCMSCLEDFCRTVIDTLDKEGKLAPQWTRKAASQMFWTIISVSNWELLTLDHGWSQKMYVKQIKIVLKYTFIAH